MNRRGIIVLVVFLLVVGLGFFAYQDESIRESVEELLDGGPQGLEPEAADESEYEAVPQSLESAQGFVGYRVQVVLNDGHVVHGTLDEVRADSLMIRQKIGGGTVSLPVKKARIVEFQQLVRRKAE